MWRCVSWNLKALSPWTQDPRYFNPNDFEPMETSSSEAPRSWTQRCQPCKKVRPWISLQKLSWSVLRSHAGRIYGGFRMGIECWMDGIWIQFKKCDDSSYCIQGDQSLTWSVTPGCRDAELLEILTFRPARCCIVFSPIFHSSLDKF